MKKLLTMFAMIVLLGCTGVVFAACNGQQDRGLVVAVAIDTLPTQLEYALNSAPVLTGGKLKITYESGSTEVVGMVGTVTGLTYDFSQAGTRAVEIQHGIFVLTFDVTVNKADLNLSFLAGQEFVYDGDGKSLALTGSLTNVANVVYEYKPESADETEYSVTLPVDAGEYSIRATVTAKANYNNTVVTGAFEILPQSITGISLGSQTVQYGSLVDVDLFGSLPAGGTYILEYKPAAAADTAYSETVPTAIGSYAVRATLSAPNHNTATLTAWLTITKRTATGADFVVQDFEYTGAPIDIGSLQPPAGVTITSDILFTGVMGTVYPSSVSEPTEVGTYEISFNIDGGAYYTSGRVVLTIVIYITPEE
ncbi:MAG: MBG domain-containing protein [Firmicutes bacterium]|nr:MBG domain-containing protein [Bacillota bacterium]